MAWFTDYWPWWVMVIWLVGYELVAVATRRPTLSQLVWRAPRWLRFLVIPLLILLVLHFWYGLWR